MADSCVDEAGLVMGRIAVGYDEKLLGGRTCDCVCERERELSLTVMKVRGKPLRFCIIARCAAARLVSQAKPTVTNHLYLRITVLTAS